MEARNPSYTGWAAEGEVTNASGNEADFDAIEATSWIYAGASRW
jgi:hypothetical protein